MFHNDDPKISKNPAQVFVRLASGKEFMGSVFLRQEERITDLLNDSREFLPVSLGGNKLTAVRKAAIEEILMDIDVSLEDHRNEFKHRPHKEYENTFILTLPQCQAILGLKQTFTKDEVVERHRKLINHLHPDRGGSDYLTGQLNAARDFLLKTFKSEDDT